MGDINSKTHLYLTLVLECNGMPKLDEVNDAVQRRIEVIPFVSKFVDETEFNKHSEEQRMKQNMSVGDAYYKTDEFRESFRQALMKKLMDKFEGYRQRGFKFSKLPSVCSEKAKSYLATSDDIYSWFVESFEKVDDDSSFLYFDDIYGEFTRSTYYTNMSKKDKRDMNKSNFSGKFSSSLYLKSFVRERKVRYAGIQHSKAFIIKFKKIEDEGENFLADSVGCQTT